MIGLLTVLKYNLMLGKVVVLLLTLQHAKISHSMLDINIIWYKSVAPSYTYMFVVLNPKTDPINDDQQCENSVRINFRIYAL